MSASQHIHTSIEFWGAFFCLVSIINASIKKNYDKKATVRLVALMVCLFFLMISDGLAWMFRGHADEAGYYIVRISNFCAFFFGFLTMPLVTGYLSYIIRQRTGIKGRIWKAIEWALFLIGTILLTVNIFYEFIYSFDGQNNYYRLAYSFLPGAVAFAGIVITTGVVVEYLKYLYSFEKNATLIYLVLPLIAIVIQSLFYGVSLVYITLVISGLMLYVSYEVNYINSNIEKERKLADERIRLFNQQIQPHFLFNSLSVIKHLIRKSPDEATRTVDEFAGYLRNSTDLMNSNDCVPVSRELELVEHYLYMQKKYFGDSIAFEFDIRDTDFSVPPFSIQTNVENGLKHGLRAAVIENGKLTVRTYRSDGAHLVEIKDNGAGFDTAILNNTSSGEHVGIQNTIKRLQILCGGEMTIDSEIGKGTKVTMTIPVQRKK